MTEIKHISPIPEAGFSRYLRPAHLIGRLSRSWDLLVQFVWWEVNDRYRGSALGMLWTIIVPLLRLSVYAVVFSVLLGGRKAVWGLDSNLEVGMMIYCGFIVFNVFAEAVGKASRLMWINKSYVKNIAFPLEIIVVTTIGVAMVHTLIGLGVLIFLELVVNGSLHWTLIYLPLVFLPLVFFVTGISWMLAAFGVFSRDIDNLMQTVIQMMFLLSAIIFPLDRLLQMIPDRWEWMVRINILATIVEDTRRIVLEGASPDWFWLGINLPVSILLLLAGYAAFMFYKKDFADVV